MIILFTSLTWSTTGQFPIEISLSDGTHHQDAFLIKRGKKKTTYMTYGGSLQEVRNKDIIGINKLDYPYITSDNLNYSEVIEIDKTQTELHDLLEIWIAETYNSYDDVIHYNNRSAGKIIAKGIWTDLRAGYTRHEYFHQISIDIKDSKYRVTFDQIYLKSSVNDDNIHLKDTMFPKMKVASLNYKIWDVLDDIDHSVSGGDDDW